MGMGLAVGSPSLVEFRRRPPGREHEASQTLLTTEKRVVGSFASPSLPFPSDHFAFAPIASPRRVVTGDLCSLRPYLPSLPLLTISEVVDYCPISRV